METAIIALIPQLIGLLPVITTGVEHFVAWISALRTAAKQSNEWTPEMESAFINSLILRAVSNPAYQPDKKV